MLRHRSVNDLPYSGSPLDQSDQHERGIVERRLIILQMPRPIAEDEACSVAWTLCALIAIATNVAKRLAMANASELRMLGISRGP